MRADTAGHASAAVHARRGARGAPRSSEPTHLLACRPDARAAQQRAASPVAAPARSAAHAHAVAASATQVARARQRRAARAAAGTCSRPVRAQPRSTSFSELLTQTSTVTHEMPYWRCTTRAARCAGQRSARGRLQSCTALFTAKCFHRAASRAAATALAPARAADCQRPSRQRARRATRGRRRGGRRTRNALDTWRNLDTHTTRFPP